jgi:hypothetical protein
VKRERKKMVMGMYVELGAIHEMLGKTIMGRFYGKWYPPGSQAMAR